MHLELPVCDKETPGLSLLAGAAILAGCIGLLWLALLITRYPDTTLSSMKNGLWLFLPLVALADAGYRAARKKKLARERKFEDAPLNSGRNSDRQ